MQDVLHRLHLLVHFGFAAIQFTQQDRFGIERVAG